MLKIGSPAPDFTATTTDNRALKLSELRDKNVVLFFFPKAFTTGCTLETKQFRDAYPELQKLGAEVVGISADDTKTQCDFASSLGVSYPMVGDADRTVGKLYDALWPLLRVNRRVTFVIDRQGIIRGVFAHEILVSKHLQEVRSLLEQLDREQSARA